MELPEQLLVEQYHEVVCEALHYVCEKDAAAQDIPTDAKLAFFNETRRVGSSNTGLRGGVLDRGDRVLSVKKRGGCFFSDLFGVLSYISPLPRGLPTEASRSPTCMPVTCAYGEYSCPIMGAQPE